MSPVSPSLQPYLWMILGSFTFAWMSFMAHSLGQICEWQIVALARSATVFVFIGTIALIARVKFVFLRPATLWMRSMAGSVSLLCAFYALTRLPTSSVIAISNTYPVWVAVLSWPMLREVPSRRVWIAVVFAIAGVFLIQPPQKSTAILALSAAVISSMSTAVALLGLHRLRNIDPRAIVVHFSGVAVFFCLLAFLVFDRLPGPGSVSDWKPLLLIGGIGVCASCGQMLLTKAFGMGEPAKVAVVGLIQVVFGLLIDLLIGEEPVTQQMLLGITLILLPTAWVMIEKKKPPESERG